MADLTAALTIAQEMETFGLAALLPTITEHRLIRECGLICEARLLDHSSESQTPNLLLTKVQP